MKGSARQQRSLDVTHWLLLAHRREIPKDIRQYVYQLLVEMYAADVFIDLIYETLTERLTLGLWNIECPDPKRRDALLARLLEYYDDITDFACLDFGWRPGYERDPWLSVQYSYSSPTMRHIVDIEFGARCSDQAHHIQFKRA